MKLALAALAMLASASAALAIPPPPSGFYGSFRQPQINCPTPAAAQAVFDAMHAATPTTAVDAAVKSSAANGCDIGFVPGPVAVGDSAPLGQVIGEGGPVTFYSVHVGTAEKEWWVLYADTDAAR